MTRWIKEQLSQYCVDVVYLPHTDGISSTISRVEKEKISEGKKYFMAENTGKDIKNKTISNVFWRYAERSAAQGVQFIVSIILARILSPDEYGVIAIVLVFINFLQVFVDGGMGNALIQKKDSDDLDFSTIFFFNIFVCIFLYIGLFFLASPIANFYNNTDLVALLRVLGIIVLLSGVKNVQQAYISKKLLFRKFFRATIFGTVISAFVGIFLAYKGYGVWALVAQHLTNAVVDTLIIWISVSWRPQLRFSFKRLKVLFSYGWKLFVSGIINSAMNDIRQLIIGKVYTESDLAYYNRGKTFPHTIVNNINASIDSVLFPVLSKCQDDREQVKRMTRRAIMTSSFIMWPLMLGLMAVGRNLFIVVLKEKWLPSLPFLYIFCFVCGMQPIHTANLNAIKAMGRSDLFLKMEIIKKTIGILAVLLTMNISVLAIGLGSVFCTIISSIVNAFPNRKLLGYSYMEQILDILPSFALSVLMAAVVYFLPLNFMPIIVKLIIQVIVGAGIYIGLSKLFKMEAFSFVLEASKGFIDHVRTK